MATNEQYAKIIVKAVMLVMSAVGILVRPSSKVIGCAAKEAADAIQASSKLRKAMKVFVIAWNGSDSDFSKTKALVDLIKDTNAAGILLTIIKNICSEMSWHEWLLAAAQVTAMITAVLATGRAVLIAEIALVVMLATDLAMDIANLRN